MRHSSLPSKTISMPITLIASGRITIVTKSSKTCNCWIRKNSKNFSMDTTTTRTLTKKWIRKSRKSKQIKINNNARPAVLELKQLSVRKPEQEMKAVWSLKVKEMIQQVSFINTKKARTYYSNHQTWTWINGLIKQDRCHSRKSSLREPRNTDNEQLTFLRAIVIQQRLDSPDCQDLELAAPQWLGKLPVPDNLTINRNNDHL